MRDDQAFQVGLLKPEEVDQADTIFRRAFATFLGIPDPAEFMGDRQLVVPRFRGPHVWALAARQGDRLIGTNLLTQWGSFGFCGPLTVLPEHWDRGVAQELMTVTVKVFEKWGVRHSGLFTFPGSTKHVGLYQKFGYWPQHLTAVLARTPPDRPRVEPMRLSGFKKVQRDSVIAGCARLTDRISRGLDLTAEIRSALAQGVGDVVLLGRRDGIDGFAICMNGVGSEGGTKICYVKFGAVRGGRGADKRFDQLLEACEAFAAERGATVEAGMNLARGESFRHMRSRGYRVISQGVAMQRPHVDGFNRPTCWVIDDWR